MRKPAPVRRAVRALLIAAALAWSGVPILLVVLSVFGFDFDTVGRRNADGRRQAEGSTEGRGNADQTK